MARTKINRGALETLGDNRQSALLQPFHVAQRREQLHPQQRNGDGRDTAECRGRHRAVANFGSLGIMVGGLGTMAPERREEINSLGMKSIVSGTLTTCLMGAIVGVLS